ncbi:MAG: hypothetical protein AAB091_07710, partial [Elusimicrobiota bacterium]
RGGQRQVFLIKADGVTKVPASDQGFTKQAWVGKTTEVYGAWDKLSGISRYWVSLSKEYSFDLANSLRSWELSDTDNRKVIGSLALPVSRVTRLASDLIAGATVIHVLSTKDFSSQGRIYAGGEILEVEQKIDETHFRVAREEFTGKLKRGLGNTLDQLHFVGETVSDQAFFYSVRGETSGGIFIPSVVGRARLLLRTDPTPPTTPGAPKTSLAPGQSAASFEIKWNHSEDQESGVAYYEIQERADTNPIWRTVAMVPGMRSGQSINNSMIIGDPGTRTLGYAAADAPRESGHFYSYRVRSYNQAAVASVWSLQSDPASTGQISEAIKNVSNFPNPVDIRQGDYTTITYLLGADSEVTITIYDLLGYKVREWQFSAGDPNGGRAGPVFLKWYGDTDGGEKVAKGGYIARIEVKSPKGSASVIRKIGVIH